MGPRCDEEEEEEDEEDQVKSVVQRATDEEEEAEEGQQWCCCAARMTEKQNPDEMIAPFPDSWSETCHKTSLVFNYWVIGDFKSRPEKQGEFIVSPTFGGRPPVPCTTWEVHVYPKGKDRNCSNYLSIYLDLVKSAVPVSFAFKALKSDGQVGKCSECVRTFKEGTGCGFPRFLLLNHVTAPESGFLPNEELRIYTEVMLLPESIEFYTEHYSLSSDLRELVDDPFLSDLTFVVKGTEFKAHKIILAARSPVFAAMIRHSVDKKTVITDISPDVFREILHFIYTGSAPNVENVADRLLVAADKYLMEDLRTRCEVSLFAQITTDNASDMLLLAHHHGAGRCFETAVIDFIAANLKDVMKTDGWQNAVTHSYKRNVLGYDNRLQESQETPRKKLKSEGFIQVDFCKIGHERCIVDTIARLNK
ncbi:speckle-type POZ protein B-like isoform X2 [Ornithodoros turicata]|uniref:speckle-type POZ protein B-like isoform X2 n=1 Tax=Ornithodoros turicata TaxID=34597 RepID=UPI0031392994